MRAQSKRPRVVGTLRHGQTIGKIKGWLARLEGAERLTIVRAVNKIVENPQNLKELRRNLTEPEVKLILRIREFAGLNKLRVEDFR